GGHPRGRARRLDGRGDGGSGGDGGQPVPREPREERAEPPPRRALEGLARLADAVEHERDAAEQRDDHGGRCPVSLIVIRRGGATTVSEPLSTRRRQRWFSERPSTEQA